MEWICWRRLLDLLGLLWAGGWVWCLLMFGFVLLVFGVLVLGSVVCLGIWADWFVFGTFVFRHGRVWAWVGWFGCLDEPESLILAQSERWRHA